jgi:DNA-binding FadR family transcriptional regulator
MTALTNAQPMSQRRPVRRPARLSDDIAFEITQRVVGGEFAAGDLLPSEATLMESFGVSRPVIREAIKSVEQKGLVRVKQGEGTIVLARRNWNLMDPEVLRTALETEKSERLRDDVVALRRDLEVAMLLRGGPALSEADFEEMERLLRIMDTDSDPAALQDADGQFHAVIHSASGNEIAATVVLLLITETRPLRYLGNPGREPYLASNQTHRRIFELLREGNIQAAAAAMDHHVSTQWFVHRDLDGSPEL